LQVLQLVQVHLHREQIALLDETLFPVKKALQGLQDERLVTPVRRQPGCDAGDCHGFCRWQVAAVDTVWHRLEVQKGGRGSDFGINVVQKYWGSFDEAAVSGDSAQIEIQSGIRVARVADYFVVGF
jgi:hypothetical protein